MKIPENEVQEEKIALHERPAGKHKSDIVIEVVDDLMTNLARCCKPLPGDEVIGFSTQGRGVTIHRQDCSNVIIKRRDLSRSRIERTRHIVMVLVTKYKVG